MKTETKRIKAIQPLVDKNKAYSLKEAIAIIKKTPKTKFDETLEVSAKLSVDPKNAASASIRGTVALPHGTGKKVRATSPADANCAAAASARRACRRVAG